MAQDPDRLARFQREAKVLASLKRVFVLDRNEAMMVATIETPGNTQGVKPPVTLFSTKDLNLRAAFRSGYDVLPDGHFLMIELAPWEREPPVIHVILNWAEELNAPRVSR